MIKYYDIVKDMSNEELTELSKAMKARQTVIATERKAIISVGDAVKFSHKGAEFTGTVADVGRTRASVQTNFTRYRVPLNMLSVIK